MTPNSHFTTYRSLQALPTELLLKLKQEISDFSSHLAFSRLCASTRKIYTEDCFRNVCLDAGFGKPLIWHDRSWTDVACAIYYHASTCQLCGDCLLRLPEEQEASRYIYKTTAETPHVRVIPELRASIGQYDIDWQTQRKECRAVIASKKGSHSSSSNTSRCLHKHITLAARIITTLPIQSVKLAFEGDQSWGFAGFAGFDPGRIPRPPSFKSNRQSVYGAEELVDIAMSHRGFRLTPHNKEGLTCCDILTAAADIPGSICSLEDGEFLVFAGVLDDQIRRGIIWVQARTPSFSSSRALRSLPP